MNTISEKILHKIKEEQLKPQPKWIVRLRRGGQWTALAALALLMAFSIGLLWYFWSDMPWTGHFLAEGFFSGRMPILLLGLFILGGILALADFRNTGRGYRLPLVQAALVLSLMAIVVGGAMNYLGVSQRADNALGRSPMYQDRASYMKQVWQRPLEGLLAGTIGQVSGNAYFSISDFNGKLWKVDASAAVWRGNLTPQSGLQIKLIGKAEENVFIAQEVRPWMGMGGCGMSIPRGGCGMMR